MLQVTTFDDNKVNRRDICGKACTEKLYALVPKIRCVVRGIIWAVYVSEMQLNG